MTQSTKNINMVNSLFFLRISILLIALSCLSCSSNQPIKNKNKKKKRATYSLIINVIPTDSEVLRLGNEIRMSTSLKKKQAVIDSIQMFVNGKFVETIVDPYIFKWITNKAKIGKNNIKAKAWLADGENCSGTKQITLFSDIQPVSHTFKVLNRYPHDSRAYTQGLLIEDGFLYEGTGQWGQSAIRKIELKSGELLQSYNLSSDLFGEGICILDDKLYQLTWQSSVAFIYDKESFKLLRRTSYPTEGWGLTTDGTYLIMSDGTNKIYYMDPESFTEIRRIAVYDNKEAVDSLNELEYIDEKIFANVFGKTYIVIIDPETGKVIGKINLEEIIPKGFKGDWNHVLNGIAYDKEKKKMFVSGKYWADIFEIEISRR